MRFDPCSDRDIPVIDGNRKFQEQWIVRRDFSLPPASAIL